MSKHIAACLTLSLALTAADQTHAQQGAPDGEWPTYGGDLGHTRYSALDQIDAIRGVDTYTLQPGAGNVIEVRRAASRCVTNNGPELRG